MCQIVEILQALDRISSDVHGQIKAGVSVTPFLDSTTVLAPHY